MYKRPKRLERIGLTKKVIITKHTEEKREDGSNGFRAEIESLCCGGASRRSLTPHRRLRYDRYLIN
ncbi:hypothetical protein QQ045_032260 [Rhodiola kirilowii]